MGSFDIFCVVCGAGFHRPPERPKDHEYPDDSEDETFDADDPEWDEKHRIKEALDDNVVKAKDLDWIRNLRLVGRDLNFDADCDPPKGYFTGFGWHSDTQVVWVKIGTEEVCVTADFIEDFPLHGVCFQMIRRALRLRKGATSTASDIEVNLDVLFAALQSAPQQPTILRSLDLNYFEMNHLQGQGWEAGHGDEPYVLNPLVIPALKDYPFRYTMEKYYPPKPTRLFREKLRLEMPYLWEINETTYPRNIDWYSVYTSLFEMSHLKKWNRYRWREKINRTLQVVGRKFYKKSKDTGKEIPQNEIAAYRLIYADVMAVASRRRVFNCVKQLLDLYEACESKSPEE